MIMVSACLAGILCKYNGTYNTVPEIQKLQDFGFNANFYKSSRQESIILLFRATAPA